MGFFILAILAQFVFWFKTESIKPDVYIVPPVPNKYSTEAFSMGDKEFYFRILALKIQNAGDSFGRFTALKKYDYEKLYHWFTFLDSLNSKSAFIPSLASYYYSQTQNKEDTMYVVKYLDQHAQKDINKNWWWMYQAIQIANINLGNKELAVELAYKLSNNNAPNAPLWTKSYPAFLQEDLGNGCAAFKVIQKILSDNESGVRKITSQEMEFMRHFIKNRLGKLKDNKFNPRLCPDL